MKLLALSLCCLAACASSGSPASPGSAPESAAKPVTLWEAPYQGTEDEAPLLVEQVGRTTMAIPRPNPAREERRGMACPLHPGSHLGLTLRTHGDALEEGRVIVLHIEHPLSGWSRALRFDRAQPVALEACSAVDPEPTRVALADGPARQGYQPLAFWVHLPEDVAADDLRLTWSWSWE